MAEMAGASSNNVVWTPSTEVEGVTIGQALEDGPTVVVFGGVHGDEGAGIEMINTLEQSFVFTKGRVVAIMGNPRAVEAGERRIDSNLNRAFRPLTAAQKGHTKEDLGYEIYRGQELMQLIEDLDEKPVGLYDAHEYLDENGRPHIITEAPSIPLARHIGAAIVVSGFVIAEPGGTDGYAFDKGYPAICAEIGTQGGKYQEKNVALARQMSRRFLAAMGLSDEKLPPLSSTTQHIEIAEAFVRQNEDFVLEAGLKSLQQLGLGQLLATDGDVQIRSSAVQRQIMLFAKQPGQVPPQEPPVGGEYAGVGNLIATYTNG